MLMNQNWTESQEKRVVLVETAGQSWNSLFFFRGTPQNG
jgi:hypothetical protein